MNVDDLILVSVDDHICEPIDMFEKHVPAKYADQAPRVITDDDGHQQWWYGDIKGRNIGINAAAGKPRRYFETDPASYSEMRAGCYLVSERIRDMDANGQLGALSFPNWTGFAGQVLSEGPDPDVNEAMVQAYNDWHVDEWCGYAPDRLIPCGILPLFDPVRCAKEVRRLAKKGCHAVTFTDNARGERVPTYSLHSGAWDPFLAACADEGTVVCVHLGVQGRQLPFPSDAPPGSLRSVLQVQGVISFNDLLWADFWDRFPALKVSMSEGNVSWMPYYVRQAEEFLAERPEWTYRNFPEGGSPRQIFLDHILTCFITDQVDEHLLNEINPDHIMWESDFPHSSTSWPRGPESVMETIGHLSDEMINKITHLNAMREYQFDPFEHRDPKDCTVGALRALATDVDTTTHMDESKVSGLDELRTIFSGSVVNRGATD